MMGFAISAASMAVIALVVGGGLFLKDYRGGVACKADHAKIVEVAQANHARWKQAEQSAEATCNEEIASATKLARQEAALEATDKALASIPTDTAGECNVDSPIRWTE